MDAVNLLYVAGQLALPTLSIPPAESAGALDMVLTCSQPHVHARAKVP